MTHRYPEPGQAPRRQDGEIDQRYLRGFQRELSNMLIQANYTEIIVVGAKIHEAKIGQYWKAWPDQDPPFRSFGEWCWSVLSFRERKADALQKIYLDITAMNLSEPTLYRALRMGWTKLNVMLRAARSEVVLIRWIDRVEEHNLTLDELQAEITSVIPDGHRSSAGTVADAPEKDGAFSFEPPPQRPKAKSRPVNRKAQMQDDDSYCDDEKTPPNIYPPGGEPAKQIRKTLIFEDQDTASLVFRAIKTMQDAAQGEIGAAKAISLICQHYMAVVNAETAGTLGGQVIELEKVLQGLELAYGVPIVVGSETGLLAKARDLLSKMGADSQQAHPDQKKLLKQIDKVLRR